MLHMQAARGLADYYQWFALATNLEQDQFGRLRRAPVSRLHRCVQMAAGLRTGVRAQQETREETDWQIGVENCAPDCALTGGYPRQTPSLTGIYGKERREGQVVETTAENVIRYVSTLLQRSAFQACSFNHSDISPFRINHLRVRGSD